MSDIDPIGSGAHGASAGHMASGPVRFSRRELDQILQVYGRHVAAGAWHDYAIDFDRDAAVFSIFQRSRGWPLYRIEKRPKLRSKQGAFAVVGAGGLILKRGHDLAQVLKILEKKRFAVVE